MREKVVISLTTLPTRLDKLLVTLKSLNNQTVPPDEIYLTLPINCERLNMKYTDITDQVKNLCTIVKIDQDYGPITKIVGALKKEKDPDTIIITVDDDIIYPPTLIEDLMYWHGKYPDSALGSSGLAIGSYPFRYSLIFNQEHQNHWFTMKPSSRRNKTDIIYGYAGALYKRYMFPSYSDLYDELLSYCMEDRDLFLNDDVVLSCYLNKQEISRRIVRIDEVIEQPRSNNDALSLDTYTFFTSLVRAVNKCDEMGWVRKKAYVHPKETFGAVALLIILLIIGGIIILNKLRHYII